MDLGPYMLPGLAILMVVILIYVTAAWVFDGTQPEEDVAYLDSEKPKNELPPIRRRI